MTRGFPIALASAAVLSTTALFIRTLSADFGMPPLVLAFWRDLIVAACLGAYLALAKPALLRAGRGNGGFLALLGLALAVFNGFLTVSVAANGAALSTVLVYSSAAFAPLLGRFFKGERIGASRVGLIAFCLAGCALAAGIAEPAGLDPSPAGLTATPLGIVAGMLSGLCYAIYSMMAKEAADRNIDARTTLFHAFGIATPILLAFTLIPGSIVPGNALPPPLLILGGSVAGWLLLLALSVGPTLFGFGLYALSVARLGASRANLIAMAEVAITGVLAWLLFGEALGPLQVLGAVMLVGGIVGMRFVGDGGRSATP